MKTDQQLKILALEFEQIKQELIKRHDELGMRASGKWAESLEVEIQSSPPKISAKITGLNYTEQLQFGRRPGRRPPIEAIKQWILDKPITFIEAEISLTSLAFAIATNIAKRGTRYYQQGGTDLVDSVISEQKTNSILNSIGDSYIEPIISGFITQLKQDT